MQFYGPCWYVVQSISIVQLDLDINTEFTIFNSSVFLGVNRVVNLYGAYKMFSTYTLPCGLYI